MADKLRHLQNASAQIGQRQPFFGRIIGAPCAIASAAPGLEYSAFDSSRQSRLYSTLEVLDWALENSKIAEESPNTLKANQDENVLESVRSNLRPLRKNGPIVAAWPLIVADSTLSENEVSNTIESLIGRGTIYEPILGFFSEVA